MAIKEEFEDTKGEAESVHRRRTDNTMAKRKRTIEKKQQSTKHYTENDRSSNTYLSNNRGELRYSGRISSSCSTSGTRRFAAVYIEFCEPSLLPS